MLKVSNMKGALVKRIANGVADVNRFYDFELSSDSVREGIYITRLTTASTVKSLKMAFKR